MRLVKPLSGPIGAVEAVEYRDLICKTMSASTLEGNLTSEDVKRTVSIIKRSRIVLWDKSLYIQAGKGSKCFDNTKIPPDIWRRGNELWICNWESPSGGIRLAPNEKTIWKEAAGVDFILVDCEYLEKTAVFWGFRVTRESDIQNIKGIEMTEGAFLKPDNFGRVLMARSRFIDLEFVDDASHQWSRTEKRQLGRIGYKEQPLLRVVKVRRLAPKESEVSRSVDWSCRWEVEGHWRMQWFPSEGVHRPVYIHSYVKGPEDKPLKAKTETIFSVVR